MDMQNVTSVPSSRQEVSSSLSPSDQRLLLISTLGLFLRRLRHGIPVTREDLDNLARYTDAAQPAGKLGSAA
jgi:hypothetical protein